MRARFVGGLLGLAMPMATGKIFSEVIPNAVPAAIVPILAALVGIQQLEAHLLAPLVHRRTVRIHPLLIAVTLATGAVLLGIVGALLAVPIAGVLTAVGGYVREQRWAGVGRTDPAVSPTGVEPARVGKPAQGREADRRARPSRAENPRSAG